MKKILGFSLIILILLSFVMPAKAAADDIIKNYTVEVTPQPDGSLVMKYVFNDYCASTDFPIGKDYLEVGVPNRNFSLVEYGPSTWIASAMPKTSGGSWVHLEFLGHPVAGDCFDFYFVIKQAAMAHLDGENLTFEFTPGWFSFAGIENLLIIWQLPEDQSLVQSLDPQPQISGSKAIWEAKSLASNQKYTISLTFSKAAYPDYKEPDPAAQTQTSPTGDEGGGLSWFWIIVILVIILIVLLLIAAYLESEGGGGSYGGSILGGGGGFGGGFGGGGSSGSSSSGGGSYAGRGSSCACVSCACACACAGGGRAGCSRKKIGFMINKLLKRG